MVCLIHLRAESTTNKGWHQDRKKAVASERKMEYNSNHKKPEGKAELVTEGELYEQAKQMAEAMKLPTAPQAAIKVKVDKIYSIGVPEPGKRIA
jgi:hypothetical protein